MLVIDDAVSIMMNRNLTQCRTQYAPDRPPLFVRWRGLAGGGLNGARRAAFGRFLGKMVPITRE